MLKQAKATPLKDAVRAYNLLKRPEISYEMLEKVRETDKLLSLEVKEQVEIQIKYERYIKKAREQVERMLKMEDKKIPQNKDYDAISGLASEAKEKLKKVRPL